MSNFNCERCGASILEGPGGAYETGCEHHPKREPTGSAYRSTCQNCGATGLILAGTCRVCLTCGETQGSCG